LILAGRQYFNKAKTFFCTTRRDQLLFKVDKLCQKPKLTPATAAVHLDGAYQDRGGTLACKDRAEADHQETAVTASSAINDFKRVK
jgi:hypothetical protein